MGKIFTQNELTPKDEVVKETVEKINECEAELGDLEKQEISLKTELQIKTKISQEIEKFFEGRPDKDFMKQKASDEMEEAKYALLHLEEEKNNVKTEIDYNRAKLSILENPTFYISR